MNKLKRLLKRLLAAGIATAEEKAEVKTLFAALEAEDQKEVKADVEAVKALAEESDEGDDDEDEDEDEDLDEKGLEDLIHASIQSEMKNLKPNPKLAKSIAKGVSAGLADVMDQRSKAFGGGATVEFDAEGFKRFAEAAKKGEKAEFTVELKGVSLRNQKSIAKGLNEMLKQFYQKDSPGDPADLGFINETVEGEWPTAELEPGINAAPKREPFIEELVTVGNITSNLDAWIEKTNQEGQVLPVAELAKLPKKSWEFARRTAEVKKVGAYAKYSAEMAEDLPSLVSEIQNYLVEDARLAVDEQLLSGDGEGENLVGILENATDFVAGDFAGAVKEANRFDVIEAAVNQVVVALHRPTHVVVHPTDRAKMRLSKGADGHYVLPPFIMADGTVISGVRVVTNVGIGVGKFLVGDFTKSSVKYRRRLTLAFSNSDDDDFTRDRFTVKATVRLVQRVKGNDYEAFVYGDFNTAITALDES